MKRAIVVAGESRGGRLEKVVEENVRQAYGALLSQGYTDETIFFLSPIGIGGVDASPSVENLREAIEQWAGSGTEDLVIYLAGGGEAGRFRINAKESLSAEALESFLDTIQSGDLPGPVVVIDEGCESGSFVAKLTPPLGKERIVITSTAQGEGACYVLEGAVSFSRFFWDEVSRGASVREAFLEAKNAIRYVCPAQTPQIEDNGNGIGNEKSDGKLSGDYRIGAGVVFAGDLPVIGSIVSARRIGEEHSAPIWVREVTSTGVVERVWAVITPPEGEPASPSVPVLDLPTLELSPSTAEGSFEGVFTRFTSPGTYGISVFALDSRGRLSLPKRTRILRE